MKKKKPIGFTLMMMLPLILLVVLAGWVTLDWFNGGNVKEITKEETKMSEQEETIKQDPIMESSSDMGLSEESSEAPITKEEITISFVGDILLSDHVLGAYDKGNGITGILENSLLDKLKDVDIFMGNEEFPFSDRGVMAKDKKYTFRLPPDKISIFSEMGLDIVTLANNHALDFGTDALLDTFDVLDKAGIKYIGAGENIDRAKKLETIEAGGWQVGFLAASRVIPEVGWNASSTNPGMLTTYDPDILLGEIEKADKECDFLVVYVHWGIERNTQPEEYQTSLAKRYIDAGADLVVGSHPHVLQGIEYYEGKPIIYSLGNFLFGSSIPKTAVMNGVLSEDGGLSLYLTPCTSLAGYTKEIGEPEKREEFYRYMEGLSWGIRIENETGRIISE